MQKVQVALLRGGPSREHDVSMNTGASVLEALKNTDFVVRDIIITRNGVWIDRGFERSPQDALAAIDVVFIALHGEYGEDGGVQRILDRLAIPYTGSKALPSSIAMNKLLTKEHLKESGIQMAKHLRVRNDGTDLYQIVSTIERLFGPEYVVKPITGGSSIQVRMAKGSVELHKALQEALKENDEVLVEERISGKEATVGVIERFRNRSVYSLPVVEIVPPEKAAFFDYEYKYNGQTEEICPGRFSRGEKEALENAAALVHQTLELSQYSRSDFIVNKDGIYFLEVNTLPGLTSESLLPKSLAAVGCPYQEFLAHLLSDALERHR